MSPRAAKLGERLEPTLPETEAPHQLEVPLPGPRPEDVIVHLERDQLVAETFRPVPPAVLSTRVRVALWGLRIAVVVLATMVLYTFFSQLS